MTILFYLIVFFHVIACLFLIAVVLLQQGKGQDLASAFGGGGTQTAFGPRGSATVLSRATTIPARPLRGDEPGVVDRAPAHGRRPRPGGRARARREPGRRRTAPPRRFRRRAGEQRKHTGFAVPRLPAARRGGFALEQ
jgi:protein translocase SecG subunit